MLELNMIYNEDCLQVMKRLPDNCIDLVVTDCPYKIIAGGVTIEEKENEMSGIMQKRYKSDNTRCSNKWLKKNESDIVSCVRNGKMFKHNDIKFKDWLPDLFRILKDNSHCYIMVNGRNLKELQTEAEKVGFKFLNLLCWKKNNLTPNKFYMNQLEFILLLRKGGAKWINNLGTSNCLEVPNIIGNKKHPTEKPVRLMEILISNSSKENEVVFDPFLGSGTTAVACKNLNRYYIGAEIDKDYFEIAQERIN